jgi:hypothetical protein
MVRVVVVVATLSALGLASPYYQLDIIHQATPESLASPISSMPHHGHIATEALMACLTAVVCANKC